MSLSAEEFANETFNLPYPNFRLCRFERSASHDILIYSPTISTSQYVGDTCHANEKGQGHVRPKSSGEHFFTATINTPSPLPHFLYSARPLSLSRWSFSNPGATATPSSRVRKSFTASTSSPSYSSRPRKSSLRRCCSCLPPLS